MVVKCLVTGGAGFIGSHIIDRLMSKEGNHVTVYDNLNTGKKECLLSLWVVRLPSEGIKMCMMQVHQDGTVGGRIGG